MNVGVKKFIPLVLLILAAGLGIYFVLRDRGQSIEIKKSSPSESVSGLQDQNNEADASSSPISGLVCDNAARRAIAVMLSGDAVVRPLSGISEADLVINMPVFAQSITRFMAVFVCNNPKEIGSIRSARPDFIPLAAGFDAIYSHWGGSSSALGELNSKIIDDIDALTNPFNAYFRKSNIAQPHNGFSSMNRLINTVQKLGFRTTSKFAGYPHLSSQAPHSSEVKSLVINYPDGYDVKYDYDPILNSYLRWRDGKKEIDKNNDQPVVAKNVVIMRATATQVDEQYNTVQVQGEGKAAFYRNGEEVFGKWTKDPKKLLSKLYFYDDSGKEIKFVPGQIWIEIIDPAQSVEWRSA